MNEEASSPWYTFLVRLIMLLVLVFGMSAAHLPRASAAHDPSPRAPVAASELLGPIASVRFGSDVFVLANGNSVVTDPAFGEDGVTGIGAVYLYDGSARTELSRLSGPLLGIGASLAVFATVARRIGSVRRKAH